MGAENPERRKQTAKELAERFGVSDRTVRRLMAEPRESFLARAQARRDQAVELRSRGMTHSQIAAEMGISRGTVGRLLLDARKLAERDEVQAKAS